MLETTDREPSKQTQTSQQFDSAVTNFLGNYIWRAVHALMEHDQFDASPTWISKKLGVPLEEVVEALDGLLLLGLAQRTEKGFAPKQIQFLIPENEMNIDVRMDKHSLISQQILNRLDPNKWTLFRQGFIASNKNRFNEFREKLNVLVDEFFLNSTKEPKDGLYCFTATGVNIMEKEQGNGGAR